MEGMGVELLRHPENEAVGLEVGRRAEGGTAVGTTLQDRGHLAGVRGVVTQIEPVELLVGSRK